MSATQSITKQNKLVQAKNAQEKTLQVFRENFNLTSFNKLKEFDQLLVTHFQKKHLGPGARYDSETRLKQGFLKNLGALKGKVSYEDYVFMFENRGFFSALGKSHSLNTDLIKELYRDLDAVEKMHKVQPSIKIKVEDVGSLENTILLPEKIYNNNKFNAKGANKISLAVEEGQSRVYDFEKHVIDVNEQINLVQESLNKLTGAFNDKLEIELSTLPSLVEETLFIKGCLDHWKNNSNKNNLKVNIEKLKINPDALMSIYSYLTLPRQEEPARKSIFSFENRQTPLGGIFPAASALKTLWEHANESNSRISLKKPQAERINLTGAEDLSFVLITSRDDERKIFTTPPPASIRKIDKTLLRKKAINTFIKAKSSDRAKVIKNLKLFNKKLAKCLNAKDPVDNDSANNLQIEYDNNFKKFTGLDFDDYKLLFENRDLVMRFFQLYNENSATIKSMFKRWEIIAQFKVLELQNNYKIESLDQEEEEKAKEIVDKPKIQLPKEIHNKFANQIRTEVANASFNTVNLKRAQEAMDELKSCFDNYAQIRPQTLPLLVKNTLILNAYILNLKSNLEMISLDEGQKSPDKSLEIEREKDENSELISPDKKPNCLDINSYVLRKVKEYLDGIFNNTLPQTESLQKICLGEKSRTFGKTNKFTLNPDSSSNNSNRDERSSFERIFGDKNLKDDEFRVKCFGKLPETIGNQIEIY